jgi:hypothetical protein
MTVFPMGGNKPIEAIEAGILPSAKTALDDLSWWAKATMAAKAAEVLPPKSPKMSGAGERCNGAWRYEFYAVYDLPRNVEAINPLLDAFQHL